MADIRPFRGLRYSPKAVAPLTNVLCPPYDIITHTQHEGLQRVSPYNAVHLEFPQGDLQRRYARAAQAMGRWQLEGVLERDPQPSYYVVRHRFHHQGQELERWGLTACVRLEEFHRQVVLPHEETGAAHKEDRFRLMEACQANISPIMMLYQDPQRRIASAVERLVQSPPTAIATYDDDQDMALWVVDAPELDNAVQSTFQKTSLFIADGHHRYETALHYRDQARQQEKGWDDQDAFNYMMVTLIAFDDPGLLVLPYHRTLGGMELSTVTAVHNRIREVFHVQSFTTHPTSPKALEEAVVKHGKGTSLGLLGPNGEGPYLLTLHTDVAQDDLLAFPGGEALRESEGWVLQHAVLEHVLGSVTENHLTYVHDPHEAWNSVMNGRQQMAFFLKPFPLGLFHTVVSTGQRLPSKSTYFYPKLPTGLVINLLTEKL